MLEFKESMQGWSIKTDNAKIITAITSGLQGRLENVEECLKANIISNREMALEEIEELKGLIKIFNKN